MHGLEHNPTGAKRGSTGLCFFYNGLERGSDLIGSDSARRLLRWLVLLLVLLAAGGRATVAAEAAEDGVPPAKIRALVDLLADPDVRAYLDRRIAAAPKAAAAQEAGPPPGPAGVYAQMSAAAAARLGAVRERLGDLAATVPRLPAEFDRAQSIFLVEYEERGVLFIGGFFLLFVGLGFAAEQLFHRIMRPARTWLLGLKLDTVRERVRAVFARFAYGLGVILSVMLGSIGAFLLIDWPPLLREILLGYLFAQIVLRLAFAVGRLLLAPGAERFRVVPMQTPAAAFLYRRFALAAGLVAFGEVTIGLLGTFGFSPASRDLLEIGLAAVVIGIAVEIVWRCPPRRAEEAAPTAESARAAVATRWLWTLFLIATWLFFSLRSPLGWLLVFAVGMPQAMRLTQQSVDHILRPAGAAETAGPEARSVEAVVLERGARSAILVVGTLALAHAFGIDLIALTMNDSLGTRLTRGALNAVMIVLIADFVWHVAGAMIDQRLASATQGHAAADARTAARLQTLLPILKNLLFVVILVLTGMMILSALGFEIGPLIASAGVIGVAIGFGAQTLVRDIISGIFYLLDDAFRVGEYIQSGSYKGTVESFSLRSVKLRHHRGPLFTVPFGVLGAIQNMSRDWVIEKISIGVSYRTDLALVRKIIKGIGAELAADPELGPEILSPLKMQGVEQFGDYAMQIRLKMMTRPGDAQFAARRRALAMIKTAFDEKGISFAQPSVQVTSAGEPDEAGAAAAGAAAASVASPGATAPGTPAAGITAAGAAAAGAAAALARRPVPAAMEAPRG